jgi:hypothetical protein
MPIEGLALLEVFADAFRHPHFFHRGPLTYLKLVRGGVKHHLCLVDQPPAESVTLCGCVVTRPQSWTHVSSLEGDECPQCAALAFGGGAPKSAPQVVSGICMDKN